MDALAVPRIDVEEARRKVATGEALLVCAYGDNVKCKQLEPEGSLTLSELESRLPALPKDKELTSIARDRPNTRPPVRRRGIGREASRTPRRSRGASRPGSGRDIR